MEQRTDKKIDSNNRLAIFRGDKALWIIVALLLIISVMVIYSSTGSMAYRKLGGDTSFYLMRQLRYIIGCFLLVVVVHLLNVDFYLKRIKWLFWIAVILSLLVYEFGVSYNGARRWLPVPGTGLTFSPSDILKITLPMLLAVRLGRMQKLIRNRRLIPSLTYGGWKRSPKENLKIWNRMTKPILIPICVAVLVVLPVNFSTAALIGFSAFLLLWVARVNVRELGKVILLSVVALIFLVSVMKAFGLGRAETWVNRAENFVTSVFGIEDSSEDGVESSEENFQREQARIAIASGGVIGKGPGNSTQRSQLPHPYSDFAYAFIVEEYGVFGGIVVMFLYLWMLYRAGVIIRRTRNPIYSLVVFGIIIIVVLQAFINICVSIGIFPITGQTLPFISLGGSSLLFTSIALGIVLGISRESNERILEEKREKHRLEKLLAESEEK